MIVVLRIVQAVQQLFVTVAFVVGALGDLARQVLDLGLEAQHLLEGLGGLLDASVVVSATRIVCGR